MLVITRGYLLNQLLNQFPAEVTVQAQVVMNVAGSKHWEDGEGAIQGSPQACHILSC